MSLNGNNVIGSSGHRTNQPPYEIDQSVRLDNYGADNAANYLARMENDWTSDGNQKTWTISWWMKWDNEDSSSERFIYHVRGDAASSDVMGNDVINLVDGKLQYYCYTGGWSTLRCKIKTNQVFRDPSAWYHCMIVMDSTLATAADRTKFYVNGERVTSFDTDTQIPQDQNTNTNMNANTYVGASISVTSTESFGGYLAEFHRIDGQALGPEYFGETNSSTNQWVPIEVTGVTYGTNGFYQKYSATELANSFTDSAEGHVVTANGNVHTDTSVKKIGTASAQFDGTGDYLSCADSSDWDFLPASGYTAEAWYKPITHAGTDFIIGQSVDGNNYWMLGHEDGAGLRFESYSGGGLVLNITGGEITDTNWHHIAVVRDGSDVEIFKDGTSVATGTTSSTATFSGELRIGQGAAHGAMDGYLDEIRLSNTARYTSSFTPSTTAFTDDANTMLLLHCDGSDSGTTFTDSSTRPRHAITVNGDVTNTRAKKKIGNSSIYFAGTNDYLQISDGLSDFDFGTEDVCIEFWINTTQTTSPDVARVITRGDHPQQWFFRSYSKASEFVKTYIGGSVVAFDGSSGDEYVADGAWHHIALVRQSTALRCYIDGVQRFSNTSISGSWTVGALTDTLAIGQGITSGTGEDFTGYLDEIRISVGNARYPDGTTFTPSTTAFTADANTKLLIHSDWNGGLGADSSGNTNDFTPTNLVATDQMLDSPTNNFCTLNGVFASPAGTGRASTLSEGNLKATTPTSGVAYNGPAMGTIGMNSGKWYFEWYIGSANWPAVGIAKSDYTYNFAESGYGSRTLVDDGSLRGATSTSSGITYTTGDIIGCAVDMDNGKMWFSKNGTFISSGDPAGGTNAQYTDLLSASDMGSTGQVLPYFSDVNWSTSDTVTFNAGQDSSFAGAKTAQGNTDGNGKGDFYYTPPTGYLALCSDNLSNPSIADPTKHFNTVLYSGNDTSQSISGVGFSPELLWLKLRTANNSVGNQSHSLQDIVRGAQKQLVSNANYSEWSETDYVTSFDSDGFSVGSSTAVNDSGNNYVTWNWKAGGTAVSDSSGDITVSRSTNTDNGISIISYTGNQDPGGTGETIAHGLSQAPEIAFFKNRDGTNDWIVGCTPVGWTQYASLNQTDAFSASDSPFRDTAPTSSYITLGGSHSLNKSANDYICYAFHSSDIISVGSYTGNGSADGPMVYTNGFRPAWIMCKRTDASGQDWRIVDDKRDVDNVVQKHLRANTSDAEVTSGDDFGDIVSNGFKIRTTSGGWNASGGTYIYLAMASTSFKTSNAR